jgi:putative ABC transport system permease protein
MNRPRTHKILADLWGNRARSLLVVASITVGLLAIGVIATIRAVISEDMRDGYAAVNPANIHAVTSLFNQDMVEHLQAVEGVRQIEGIRLFAGRLEASPGEWVAIDLQARQDGSERQIDQLHLLQGKWPPDDREIVIEQYKAGDTKAKVGDFLTIEMPGGKARQVKLVGIVADQTVGAFSGGPGFFLAPVQGYINQETVEWLGQSRPRYYNLLHATVQSDESNEAHIRQVSDRLREEIEHVGGSVISIAERSTYKHPNSQFVDALSSVLFLLGLFVVFLSAFLITNTLQAILNQQVQQIGILKTIGSRRYQIVLLYMGLIFVFGILAALISIPLSYRTAFERLAPLTGTVNMVFRGPRFIAWPVILQIVIALAVPQIAALLPILQGSRISVQEALSGIRQSQATALGRCNPVPRSYASRLRRLSRPTLIAIRNTFRRKGRLVLTLVTLSLGGAIFIATFNVRVSMNGYVDQISRYFLADVNLTLAGPRRIDEISQILMQVPGVTHVEGWGGARSELMNADGSVGENVQILAPPGGSSLVKPVILQGRWLVPGDQNAVALNERFLSDFPDLKVGDTLRLQVNDKETDWVVIGFFQLAGRSAGYMAYANYEYLSQLIHLPSQAAAFRVVAGPDMSSIQQEHLGKAIEQKLQEYGVQVADISTGSYLSRNSAQGFAALTNFLLFLASLTALVGSIGLAGTMSLNIMERTREIGIMRAIGATNRILMKLVIVEGMIIGLLSWLIAVLLAFPMSKLLVDSVAIALFGNRSSVAITPTGFIIWLGAVLALSLVASILPARSAARLTIREVLAYE